MKLLWSSRSPFVRKIVVVAHELGIAEKIALERVRVTSGETNAGVMHVNPLNKIPTLLLDDGTVLFNSAVIAAYLDETYGRGELFPRYRAPLAGRAAARARRRRHEPEHRPPRREEPRAGVRGFRVCLPRQDERHLDALEAETDSLAPLTVGSIAVAVALGHLDFRFAEDGWRNPRPKLAEWHARFVERPSMRATEHQDVY